MGLRSLPLGKHSPFHLMDMLLYPGLEVPRGPLPGIKCQKGVQRTVCLHVYYKTWVEIAHRGISKFRVVGLFTLTIHTQGSVLKAKLMSTGKELRVYEPSAPK
ncbi:hypothetical protein TNCT_138641 [Trichonephila clavata]|uniref:Uncharacterized protein n=1 Tax=Trichonephila clavata TaxID=2740835 RepID=A0A8X6LK59_TRICU|nr:hypothetical protein TNCT_138641 [Trichonephila clavata]